MGTCEELSGRPGASYPNRKSSGELNGAQALLKLGDGSARYKSIGVNSICSWSLTPVAQQWLDGGA